MATTDRPGGEPDRRSGSRLVRASGWLLLASIAGGAIGYGYQVLVGRLLSPEEYGTLVAMMAIAAIAGVPLTAASMVLARRTTHDLALGNAPGARATYRKAWLGCGAVALACLAVLAAVAGPLAARFASLSMAVIVAFGVMLAATVFTPTYTGYLQGAQRPVALSLTTLVGHTGKALFGCLLILAGWGVAGAFVGVALSTILVLAVATPAILRMQGRLERDPAAAQVRQGPKVESAAWTYLVASLSFAMLSQLDVAIVKGYYAPADAGAYAAASMLGKALMYLPGALVVAMFPMVVENEALERSSLHLLLQALAITGAVSGAGTLAFYATGEWMIRVFYGSAYAGAGEVLRWYGLAMMPMALIMVLEHFLLAKGRAFFAYLLLVAVPLQWGLVARFHERLLDAVWIVSGTAWALLILGCAFLAYLARASRAR